jgi:hypothetical protein
MFSFWWFGLSGIFCPAKLQLKIFLGKKRSALLE